MINESLWVASNVSHLAQNTYINNLYAGTIHSPTINIIAIILALFLGWNLWLTYKLLRREKWG